MGCASVGVKVYELNVKENGHLRSPRPTHPDAMGAESSQLEASLELIDPGRRRNQRGLPLGPTTSIAGVWGHAHGMPSSQPKSRSSKISRPTR